MSKVARPEDVLFACVAYTRPELLFFDRIIACHSNGSLQLQASTSSSPSSSHAPASLHSLPPEILLRVRTHLHTALVSSIAEEAAAALREYEDALLDGLCEDCFWWNYDMYGEDVWE